MLMDGEKDLDLLLKGMKPKLNPGTYVFITISNSEIIPRNHILYEFKEEEGLTVVLLKEKADELGLIYHFIASWITLTVHSSLNAVGLTAAVSTALAKQDISCNVVAAFHHDHLFVPVAHTQTAMQVLKDFSKD